MGRRGRRRRRRRCEIWICLKKIEERTIFVLEQPGSIDSFNEEFVKQKILSSDYYEVTSSKLPLLYEASYPSAIFQIEVLIPLGLEKKRVFQDE